MLQLGNAETEYRVRCTDVTEVLEQAAVEAAGGMGAGDADPRYAVGITSAEAGDFPERFLRRVRRGDQHGIESHRDHLGRPGLCLPRGQICDQQAVRSSFCGTPEELLPAGGENEIGVS